MVVAAGGVPRRPEVIPVPPSVQSRPGVSMRTVPQGTAASSRAAAPEPGAARRSGADRPWPVLPWRHQNSGNWLVRPADHRVGGMTEVLGTASGSPPPPTRGRRRRPHREAGGGHRQLGRDRGRDGPCAIRRERRGGPRGAAQCRWRGGRRADQRADRQPPGEHPHSRSRPPAWDVPLHVLQRRHRGGVRARATAAGP